ncbi:hypothetical protein [Pararhodospirillum photometricum]|uniref:hypothetical protein n=1 Tax=Pararhodospirillum photometricum TaxID=1084 RepID=UPI0002EE8208|nr:hypothetical protein [Pararhodospirillum photometricum]
MNRTSAPWRAAAGGFPLAALVLSACLGGPNIGVTTQAPQDHPSPDGPACVARVTLTTPRTRASTALRSRLDTGVMRRARTNSPP